MRRAAVVIVLIVGLGSILAQCLVPPWRVGVLGYSPGRSGGTPPRIYAYDRLGYHPLWNPPEDTQAQIDLVRLCVPCVAALVVCSGVLAVLRPRRAGSG